MKRTAGGEAEMISLGRNLSREFSGGEVVALVGDLGAGKTHFSKGIAEGLDCDDLVTSPTFSLVNEYLTGRVPMFHFDFYRIETIEEVEQIGWEEYLSQNGVVVVEWADKFPDCLPDETLWCLFSIQEDGTREITISR